ncbi:MAG TPA: hypothetical protein VLA54_10910, partial [Acidimicrobiia bacterium]|nr:hypothetical protein [Acidimicrobiia bacterium]
EVATFLGTLAMLVWFATVEPARLVDEQGRPQWRLFLLAGVGLAVLISAMRVLGSGTMLLTLAVGFSALAVGGVRAVRTQTHPGG